MLGCWLLLWLVVVNGNPHATILFENLLSDYNTLIRPVNNNGDTLVVNFRLKLSQILDVHEKNQIMTTNVWLEHVWSDIKLAWDPKEYGGVEVLHVPSEKIWIPDIVLFNNADGNYQIQIMTKAKVSWNGTVVWEPPAIYKSMCQIDVEWFPFDEQTCEMKFGSWTYGGLEVNLKHKVDDPGHVIDTKDERTGEQIWRVNQEIALDYDSQEWDILEIPSIRHERKYDCCASPFIDITYKLHLRRKTLFYTVHLIFPCVALSILTTIVFFLPANSGEKVSLCISILISLTVFFLLLVEIIPSTSLVIPLIGKYLLFTMVLVTMSVTVTVFTLNVHYRSGNTHEMPQWFRTLFFHFLPPILRLKTPTTLSVEEFSEPAPRKEIHWRRLIGGPEVFLQQTTALLAPDWELREEFKQQDLLRKAVDSLCYISDYLKGTHEDKKVVDEWQYVAKVMDRLFLIIFVALSFCGLIIIVRAPSIYAA